MSNNAFTPSERKAWEALGEAVRHFKKLRMSHPSHEKDFCDGIHQAQNILCQRVMQLEHPELVAAYTYSPFKERWVLLPVAEMNMLYSSIELADGTSVPNPFYEV